MNLEDEYHNGDDEGDSSDSESGGGGGELVLEEAGALSAALASLNALRVSRVYCDAWLSAGGALLPLHGALLVAHAPGLLGSWRGRGELAAPGLASGLARRLVQYLYSGRLAARGPGDGRRLVRAAWELHMEAAAGGLARLLLPRALAGPGPDQALLLRALPGLPGDVSDKLDQYIRENFSAVCECEAMSSLPLVQVELVRVTSSPGVRESPAAVCSAALQWLRGRGGAAVGAGGAGGPHQLYVDAAGALRWCGDLPAPPPGELARRREEALGAAAVGAVGAVGVEGGGEGEAVVGRQPAPVWAVVAARGERGVALGLALARGALVRLRVAGRSLAAGAGLGAALAGGAGRAGRAGLAAGVVRGALLAAGGYTRGEVLSLAARLAPPGRAGLAIWRPAAPLPAPRARAAAASLGDRLYIVGGSDGHNELDTVDIYEEDSSGVGRWVPGPRCPLALSHAGAAAAEAGEGAGEEGGALYVVGGTAGGRTLRAVHRYGPRSGRWSEAPPLLAGRSSCAAAVWAGRLWALGGCDEWRCVASTEQLVLGAVGAAGEGGGAWRAGPALGAARRSAGAAAWRGRLVLAGGSLGGASSAAVEWLSPGAAHCWAAGPPLRVARASLALAPLEGALYAVAGFDGKEFLSCVEQLLTPEGQWTLLTSAPEEHLQDDLQVLSLNGDGSTGENEEEDTEQNREVNKEEVPIEKETKSEVIEENGEKSEI